MQSTRHTGFLIIADISGYTKLLSQAELEHAVDIIHTLLDALLKSLRPPLHLAKLEGDALFLYHEEMAKGLIAA